MNDNRPKSEAIKKDARKLSITMPFKKVSCSILNGNKCDTSSEISKLQSYKLKYRSSFNFLNQKSDQNKSLLNRSDHTLESLKKMFDKITNSAALKCNKLNNPTIIFNNKVIGPRNIHRISDGIINLDELMKTLEFIPKNIKDELANEIIQTHINQIIPAVSRTSISYKKQISNKQDVKEKIDTKISANKQMDNTQKQILEHNQPSSMKSVKQDSPILLNLDFDSHIKLRLIQNVAKKAITEHKIFYLNGNYYSIRKALIKRGWIEKLNNAYLPVSCDSSTVKQLQSLTIAELALGLCDKQKGAIYKLMTLSKLIENETPSFYWGVNKNKLDKNQLEKTYINVIGRMQFNYSAKEGLCQCCKLAQSSKNPDISNVRIPRTYCMSKGEFEQFRDDFRITAAIAVLKLVLQLHKIKRSKLMSDSGTLPIWVYHFALEECAKFLKKLKHKEIILDENMVEEDEKWDEFLEQYYKMNDECLFEQTRKESAASMVHRSKAMLRNLLNLYPYVNMDGYMNLWMLKPNYGSNGCGIQFCRTIPEVLKNLDSKNNYVIQKYIEQPLLIHNTKFDIRQWFLISSTLPLTIWMYKQCYLRFSSQPYNLKELHESIHLTNNSIQCKYKNGGCNNCNPSIPKHNMWFLKDFQQYLTNSGHETAFDEIIYPGMKDCIKATILTSQVEKCEPSKGFELYGADFMLTEDFKPWLIEINTKPAMYPSTPVTSILCPAVLESVIRVIIDYSDDPKATTGDFELIYKQFE